MYEDIVKFIQACFESQRNKYVRNKSLGLLQAPELAYALWQSITMDFITELRLSNGCDQFWVVIDQYTKMSHFSLLKKNSMKVPDLAAIVAKDIWRLPGMISNIILHRD
jgi:hypothetical protein